ncbi:MAG: MgtC/SapB family protein [Bacteroidales bacterium]|jgi:putative Mg2+ transporter-C (MgtC) family protein|nr:MgtC/SapB family protein [Bacteroidales bacterium]HHV02455.1 MgtC/SapB family protein [Bacteroidales bacterium]HKM31549.1 MgtC/SapB family protein [Bacteroidales bacterium]
MLSWTEITLRLFMAAFFGGLIGIERERRVWVAGMRTHMMVCVGACLVMIVSAYGFSEVLGSDYMRLDPSRVASQVVSGIGFIGAGTILFSRHGRVRGLTTAAGLWTVAAIGLATGGGMYYAAGITTFIALIILWAIQPLETYITNRVLKNTLKITAKADFIWSEWVSQLKKKEALQIESVRMDKEGSKFVYQIRFESVNQDLVNRIVDELKTEPSVTEFSWSRQ